MICYRAPHRTRELYDDAAMPQRLRIEARFVARAYWFCSTPRPGSDFPRQKGG